MAYFSSRLDVEAINDKTWKLINQLRYKSDLLTFVIGVPTGFVTDFASVPRWPLAFWATGDTAHEAAVIHDYLYQTHITTKDMADSILLEAMEVTGIAKWRQKVMYWAVRLFGRSAWDGGLKRYTVLNGPV